MAKATKWYEVLCKKHGTQEAGVKAYEHKSIVVGTPKNKKDRYSGGCNRCKTEKLVDAKN